jgi:CelD/BcsL family acetyltransferase involved in cellulose biosynthesis
MIKAKIFNSVSYAAPSRPVERRGTMDEQEYTVEEIRGLVAFRALESEWRDLVERAPEASLYHTWEWLQARLETHCVDEQVAVLLVRSRGGGRLVGAASLIHDREGEYWCTGSLTMPDERIDVLLAGPPTAILGAVLGHLRRTRSRWRLGLPRLPETSPLVPAIPGAARGAGVRLFVRPSEPSRLVRTDGGWDAYLASRRSKVRREWRRKQKRLEAQGRVEIVTATDPETAERVIDDVLAIEEKSWKLDGDNGKTVHRHITAFYPALTRSCADRGWLRLHVLYLDGKPIAYLYGVLFRDLLYALWTSYDGEYASLSPGIVIVLHGLRRAFEEGVPVVDFLGAETRWKIEVSDGTRSHVHVCAFSTAHLGCWACSAARGRLKPLLKERAPTLLVGAKRAVERARGLWRRPASAPPPQR